MLSPAHAVLGIAIDSRHKYKPALPDVRAIELIQLSRGASERSMTCVVHCQLNMSVSST